MRLSFLGQSYETSSSAIDSVPTEETVTFLGHQSKVKRYNVSQRRQPPEELTYRGHRYTR